MLENIYYHFPSPLSRDLKLQFEPLQADYGHATITMSMNYQSRSCTFHYQYLDMQWPRSHSFFFFFFFSFFFQPEAY